MFEFSTKLCVYNDAYPTLSQGDLHGFCYAYFMGTCVTTWAEQVRSYELYNNQYEGNFHRICGGTSPVDCTNHGFPTYCSLCARETISPRALA